MIKFPPTREEVITIERPFGGWAKDFTQSGGNSAAVQGGKDQYSQSTAISLFRNGRLGHIAPGETFTKLTDTGSRVTELPLNGDCASTGRAFAVLRNCRVVSWIPLTEAVDQNYDPTAAAPNHAAHTVATSDNQDLIIFKDASGVEWVASSWEDSVDADVSRVKPDGTSQDDDWFSTLTGSGVLTKSVPHIFVEGGLNNYLHITNGQYIAIADIPNGIGNTQGLNLGVGWIATTGVKYGNYAAFGGYKSTTYITAFSKSSCRVWLWDSVNPNPNFYYDIDDYYLTKLENDNGVLKAYTQGKTGMTKVWYFNGMRFVPLFESAFIGNAPRHGGGCKYQGMLHFVGAGSSPLSVLDGKAYHNRCFVTDSSLGTPSDLGMCKEISANLLYVGVQRGTTSKTYFIMKLDSTGYYVGADFRTCLVDVGYKARIMWFKVYFSQFGTGASVWLSLFREYTSISLGGATDLLNKTLTYASLGAVSEFFFRREIDDVSSFYMNLRFNHAATTNTAAIVEKIEIGVRPIANRL